MQTDSSLLKKNSGIVFDVQHYSLYDGPGIRTTIFFKGCPLKCAWCHNPESQSPQPQIAFLDEKCVSCNECVKICPNNAITQKRGKVTRNDSRCKTCGRCASVCPSNATEMIGRTATVKDIVDVVKRDRPFYDESCGGITISGGEATMQPEFLISLLLDLKANHLHTALETCGFFNQSLIAPLTEVTDLFLFDIKTADPAKHRDMTGAGLDVISQNFLKLVRMLPENRIIARLPLIPGVNTDALSIQSIVKFLTDSRYKGIVHLMPYNGLARTKWKKIGRESEYRDFGTLCESDIDAFKKALEIAGFPAQVSI